MRAAAEGRAGKAGTLHQLPEGSQEAGKGAGRASRKGVENDKWNKKKWGNGEARQTNGGREKGEFQLSLKNLDLSNWQSEICLGLDREAELHIKKK